MRALLAAAGLAVLSLPSAADGYKFHQPAVLRGIVISAAATDARNRVITYPALQLREPITVAGADPVGVAEDPDTLTERNVMLVQLAISDRAAWNQRFSFMGRLATVTCDRLFHADNGHHYTVVLCDAKKISEE